MVVLAIAVEAIVMFAIQPNTFRKSLGTSIVSFDLADGGKVSAVIHSRSIFESYDQPDFSLATCGATSAATIFRVLPSQARPKCVVGHPLLPRFYVGTWDGGIYALDITDQGASCRRVGQHPEKFITQLRCSPDGNLVVATGYKLTVAWDAPSRELLWHGPQGVLCLAFAAQAPRLFCGLKSGEIVELDLKTGAALATIPAQSAPLLAISVSPQGEHVASVTVAGSLVLSHIASRSVAWSARQTVATCPTFLDDGKSVLTAEFDGDREFLVLRGVESGERKASLRPTEPISRIVSRGDDTFYAWGLDGPVRKWRIQGTASRMAIVPAGVVSTS